MHVRSLLLPCVLAFCLLGVARQAQAQFEVQLALNKTNFLAGEAVEATVTMVNRSGADVIMGGAQGRSWLQFEVAGSDGQPVPAMRVRADEPFVFKAGSTTRVRTYVSDTHPFGGYGSFQVGASVYHPLSQQSYVSNRVRATFRDTKAFWNKQFGVPAGMAGAGQIRRYDLVYARDGEKTYMYARLVDQRTDLRLVTYSLGQCIMIANPQITVDADNTLHVMFMTLPHIFVHISMDTQGKLSKPSYHKESGNNRPQLVVAADQRTIGVTGGIKLDESGRDPNDAPKGRSVSDRPPGL